MDTKVESVNQAKGGLDGIIGNFGVRIVKQGMKYGLDDKLTWEKPEPAVEFYLKHHNGQELEGRGWFVSRYYYTTLKFREFSNEGLCLDGGNRDTCSLTAAEFDAALTLVDARVALFANSSDVESWRESWHIGQRVA
jgi:hypothetical protein